MKVSPFSRFDGQEFRDALASTYERVEIALERIRNAPFDMTSLYVGHSGGKDSVVVRDLVDAIERDHAFTIPTVHNTKPAGVKNEVHPLTREFLYGLPRVITYCPLDSHKDLNLKVQIDGTRRSEFDRSNGRAVDVVIDGEQVSRIDMPVYIPNGLFGQSFIYPIVDWTDVEVWAYIYLYQVQYSPEYDLEETWAK